MIKPNKLLALAIVPFFALAACETNDNDNDTVMLNDTVNDTVAVDDDFDAMQDETVNLSSVGDSDISAEAEFNALDRNRTNVIINVDDSDAAGMTLTAALHSGDDCDNPGAEVESLGEVSVGADGQGSSTTEISHGLQHLQDGDYLVALIDGDRVVSCGQIGGGLGW